MNPEQLRELGRLMDVVNPPGAANPLSNCVMCAIRVAQALVGGTAFQRAGEEWDQPSDHFGGGKEFPEAEDRAEMVWAWLVKKAVPNGVYLFADGDHAFNVLRDSRGTLFLLDSNQQVYRELTRPEDFEVPFRREGKMTTVNLLELGEGVLKCHGCGLLHGNYQFPEAPARPRGGSSPKARPEGEIKKG